MGGRGIEEQSIAHTQYLVLFYLQSSTLYELLPNSPWPSIDPTSSTPKNSSLIDGVIRSMA